MADVTIIFDSFGHKKQPFFIVWLKLLKHHSKLSFNILANKIISNHSFEINYSRANSFSEKALNTIKILLKGKIPTRTNVVYKNLVTLDSPVLHFLKAQSY